VEATNDYITDVVRLTNAMAERYGAEAHHLGQTYTIKLGYTLSQREIDINVRAVLRGNPDGLGWYWPDYASTNDPKGPDGTPQAEGYDVSLDPFVPNSRGTMGPVGPLFATSHDRFVHACLRPAEATDRIQPRRRFDLWLYEHDFDHVERTVHARAAEDSSWTFVGAINPQRDRDGYMEETRPEHIYSGNNRRRAVVFHGLRRADFLTTQTKTGPRPEIKIKSRVRSDTSRLAGACALPYRATRHYVTEPKATALIEEQPRWMSANSLAYHLRPLPDTLCPDATRTCTLSPNVPVDSTHTRSWRRRLNPVPSVETLPLRAAAGTRDGPRRRFPPPLCPPLIPCRFASSISR